MSASITVGGREFACKPLVPAYSRHSDRAGALVRRREHLDTPAWDRKAERLLRAYLGAVLVDPAALFRLLRQSPGLLDEAIAEASRLDREVYDTKGRTR